MTSSSLRPTFFRFALHDESYNRDTRHHHRAVYTAAATSNNTHHTRTALPQTINNKVSERVQRELITILSASVLQNIILIISSLLAHALVTPARALQHLRHLEAVLHTKTKTQM